MKRLIILSIILLSVLIACSNEDQIDSEPSNSSANENESSQEKNLNEDLTSISKEMQDQQLTHVHGMGFTSDGSRLLLGTHAGLRWYENGKWFETTQNINDYMGFNVVNQGFYTSGHPGAQSDLPNPIGLQRSLDGGKTLESLGFVGERDFHYLAVGYTSHDILLFNPEQYSKLDQGFFLSQDNGESWESVNASNVEGELLDIALHPSNSDFMAIASVGGVYLSDDGGDTFTLLTDQAQGVGVFFDEETFYYTTYQDSASFIAYDLNSQKQEEKNLPDLGEDAPIYIAQNPQNNKELVIYTYVNENLYITENDTEDWELISEGGQIK
ncbi:F510_1955 family glycosylhydrolase [Piscibacillus sp. B03]|uniref:F510_1955 family glycosylhydrolase n=1 Tax=Piscibacillus TaxID=420644 RepID=UPI0015891FEC|nr:hypothetical protein [Piscibacillus halophilus]